MSYLTVTVLALSAVVLPCIVAFLCMPQDDGRKL